MVVLELVREGAGQGQEFQNHQKIAFYRRGKLKVVVLELVRAGAGQGQESQNHQKIAF